MRRGEGSKEAERKAKGNEKRVKGMSKGKYVHGRLVGEGL